MYNNKLTMERDEEEMQYLGLFGIYSESSKLIFKLRKIFAQITLTLILPLSIIFLAQQKVSETLYYNLSFNQFVLSDTQFGTPQYNKLSDLVSSEWALYVLFKTAYFTFFLIFSLLSTSAVVYAIACAYTSRDITFKKVMTVVPRVWKRLMFTFLCAFLTFVGYNLVLTLTLFLWGKLTFDSPSVFAIVVLCVVLVFYAVGFVYMTVIWQVASVVTVLEEDTSCGFRAMMKGRDLIKGKLVVAIVIFLKLNVCLVVIDVFFKVCVVYGDWREGQHMLEIVGFGVLFVLLLLLLILFVLVVQTVLYFVCKSYHHENIDKSALSSHLEVYLGDYVPLIAKDVQMKEYGGV